MTVSVAHHIDQFRERFTRVTKEVGQRIVGNEEIVERTVTALLAQALRKEMVEANADALGENKEKEDRRKKTEQGKSTLGYTRVAPPAAFEPSRSAAPPPVPEARRQLLLNYFIRKK